VPVRLGVEQVREREVQRSGNLVGATPGGAVQENAAIRALARDRYACQACGAPANHVDHAVPVARGGTQHEANLVAACRRCNLREGVGLDLAVVEE
jgi:hypothetical protein